MRIVDKGEKTLILYPHHLEIGKSGSALETIFRITRFIRGISSHTTTIFNKYFEIIYEEVDECFKYLSVFVGV